jgi:hypothetical protein
VAASTEGKTEARFGGDGLGKPRSRRRREDGMAEVGEGRSERRKMFLLLPHTFASVTTAASKAPRRTTAAMRLAVGMTRRRGSAIEAKHKGC